jgi:hypothetical protein
MFARPSRMLNRRALVAARGAAGANLFCWPTNSVSAGWPLWQTKFQHQQSRGRIWFTEGHDTRELKEAKALLANWRHSDSKPNDDCDLLRRLR